MEYKLFEPAFYATDLADWGSSLLVCQKLGDRAKVLVDLGHHAQGVNIEQIVAILDDEGRLGGFHFNNRKYADDDLIVASVNPFELFLIFVELTAPGRSMPRLTIDQSHNIEAKVEAMTLTVVNLQDAYAKALLVDRDELAQAQRTGDVLGAHELLLDAYRIDVRPLWREGQSRPWRRRGSGPRPARERVRRARQRRARRHRSGGRGMGPMSVVAQMIAPRRGPVAHRRVRGPGRCARAGALGLAPPRV